MTLGTVGDTDNTQVPMDGDPKSPWGGEAGGDLPSWRPSPCHRGWGWTEGDLRCTRARGQFPAGDKVGDKCHSHPRCPLDSPEPTRRARWGWHQVVASPIVHPHPRRYSSGGVTRRRWHVGPRGPPAWRRPWGPPGAADCPPSEVASQSLCQIPHPYTHMHGGHVHTCVHDVKLPGA